MADDFVTNTDITTGTKVKSLPMYLIKNALRKSYFIQTKTFLGSCQSFVWCKELC